MCDGLSLDPPQAPALPGVRVTVVGLELCMGDLVRPGHGLCLPSLHSTGSGCGAGLAAGSR